MKFNLNSSKILFKFNIDITNNVLANNEFKSVPNCFFFLYRLNRSIVKYLKHSFQIEVFIFYLAIINIFMDIDERIRFTFHECSQVNIGIGYLEVMKYTFTCKQKEP